MEEQGDEAQWIEAATRGDHEAFACLVTAYTNPVYNLAYRMLQNRPEAEDATQEIFLRGYNKLASFDRSRRFVAWLLSIAAHYCIDELRRRKGVQLPLDDLAFAVPSTAPGPESSALQNEQRQAIAQAMAALPATYCLVAVLRYVNELSYEEIAAVTELPETTVKTRLFRARRLLQTLLTQEIDR